MGVKIENNGNGNVNVDVVLDHAEYSIMIKILSRDLKVFRRNILASLVDKLLDGMEVEIRDVN